MVIFIISTEYYVRYFSGCQNTYQTNKQYIENEKSSFKIQDLASATFLIFYLYDKLGNMFYWCFLKHRLDISRVYILFKLYKQSEEKVLRFTLIARYDYDKKIQLPVLKPWSKMRFSVKCSKMIWRKKSRNRFCA